MKRNLLLALFAAGALMLTAVPARAAAPVLAFPHFRGHVVIGWGGWGPGWGWGGYPGYYEPYGYYAGRSVWSRVKTDVEPDEARLYLDGRLIGTADDFDGWPDYLYLQRGHYRLEFRLNGYETKTVELDARPGQTLRIDDHLKKIPGVPHGSYEEPKIEGGIHRYWAKRRDVAQAVTPNQGPSQRSPAYARGDEQGDEPDTDVDSDAPDRAPAPDVSPRGDDWRGGPPPPADATSEAPRPLSRTRSRLRFHVEPADAVVYVDDRFVGTAEEVNSLDRGVPVPAGKHTVTISRPGFKDKTLQIEVQAGGSENVEVSLSR